MATARGWVSPSVLPGFGLTLGFAGLFLTFIVLIPMAALIIRAGSLPLESPQVNLYVGDGWILHFQQGRFRSVSRTDSGSCSTGSSPCGSRTCPNRNRPG